MSSPLHTLSAVIGWIYFLAWSISFYPQAILNCRRKSVQGLSIDFLNYNVLGFLCYSIYNLSFFASEAARKSYEERHDGKTNLVQINDVVFSVHAFVISSFTLAQSFYYKREANQRLSRFARIILLILFVAIGFALIGSTTNWFAWIDLLYFLSLVKLVLSLIKYCPQAYINWKRKSTSGWSIHNILLDFTGGFLSIVQLFLDAHIDNNWSGVFGNPAKLLLGNISMVFDVVFILQHYLFYRYTSTSPSLQSSEELGFGSDELDPPEHYGDASFEKKGLLSLTLSLRSLRFLR